jgi:hypothetical protein
MTTPKMPQPSIIAATAASLSMVDLACISPNPTVDSMENP